MSDEGVWTFPVFPSQPHDNSLLRQRGLKRKLRLPAPFVNPLDLSYPSPPMSSPPSPSSKQQPEVSTGAGRSTFQTATTSGGSISTFAPALAITLPTAQPALPIATYGQPFDSSAFSTAPPSVVTHSGPTGSLPVEQSGTAGQSDPSTQTTSGPSLSARGGRRAKTHVASACINCKRAHLSCDIQRPCTRCVASGKQDTCVDVQHKKRGRPRLREEGEFRVEATVSQPATQGQAAVPAGPSHAPARAIASTRRRAESFRSLQSQASDDSPSYAASTPGYGPTAILQSPFRTQPPLMPNTTRPGYEVATALLNMDFVIMKANRPFEHIMVGGQDVRGRQIADIAAPADNEGFQAIRNRLRAERESREPAYMPPILHTGQDPVQGISETEVDQFTQGFSDRTYTWTHTQLGAATERFPARVRLAKASTYFVVVTLPSFRPVEPLPLQPPVPSYSGSLMLGPPLQTPERFVPARQIVSRSAPPTTYFSYPGAIAPMPSQPPPGPVQLITAQTYPAPQPIMSYQPQQRSMYQPASTLTPRLPTAEPPFDMMSFTPRSAPRDVAPPPGTRELQLPPMIRSLAAGPSVTQSTEVAMQQANSEDEEGDEGGRTLRSPRKRRRMDIDDVLQQ